MKKANNECIKNSVDLVNWRTMFNNKTFNKQVSIFDKTMFLPNLFPKNLSHLMIVTFLGPLKVKSTNYRKIAYSIWKISEYSSDLFYCLRWFNYEIIWSSGSCKHTQKTGFESWKKFSLVFCSWLLNMQKSHKFRSYLLVFLP